jgi:hypothetical protein
MNCVFLVHGDVSLHDLGHLTVDAGKPSENARIIHETNLICYVSGPYQRLSGACVAMCADQINSVF